MDITINLTELADDALAAHRDEVREAFDALVALEAPTIEQIEEAEGLGARLDEIAAEDTRRTEAAQELADRREALRNRFTDPEPEAESTEAETEVETEAAPEAEAPAAAAETEAPAEPEAPAVDDTPARESIAARASTVAVLAGKTKRPAAPARQGNGPVKIIASANTEFSAGTDLGTDLAQVTESVVAKMQSFATPNGNGETEDLSYFPIAKFGLDFPEELRVKPHSDDMEILSRAADESRLDGDSLVAAGGWCAPSETLYDLCSTESTDGIGSVPEINVQRGGIKYTSGPDFSSIYGGSGYFDFTEAQSIAGTGQAVAKPCMTIPCPSFTDVRMDAVGLCIKIDILQNSAYPELTQRFTSGALIAHQFKVWNKVLAKMLALATAKTSAAGPLGSTAADTFDGLALYAAQLRQKYRLPLSTSLEVMVPVWVREVIRSDISRRTGQPFEQVSDEQINAMFRARKMNPQFVYGLNDLPLADVTGPPAIDSDAWPTTFTALMYPAGTFVKGTSDVINLSAVYDAASLATNTYTGLFMEQGVLVAQMCPEAFKVTLPVCNAGRTGAANLTCA